LDQQPLRSLVYTVFDTETTGLVPGYDEIVAIGALRIVNGRLLRQESFEQLVDPGRPIPTAASDVHGIGDARQLPTGWVSHPRAATRRWAMP
jgi:DNA polymerase-3 subunit epsilon